MKRRNAAAALAATVVAATITAVGLGWSSEPSEKPTGEALHGVYSYDDFDRPELKTP